MSDRILACNGEDFTAEANRRVEERFREMVDKEPLLRIAVTCDLTTALHQSPAEDEESVVNKESERSTEQARPNAECENTCTVCMYIYTYMNVLSCSGLKKVVHV